MTNAQNSEAEPTSSQKALGDPAFDAGVTPRQRSPTITADSCAVSTTQDFNSQHQCLETSSDPLSSWSENVPPIPMPLEPPALSSTSSPDPQVLLAIPNPQSRRDSIDHSVSSYGGETARPSSTTSDGRGLDGLPAEIISPSMLEDNGDTAREYFREEPELNFNKSPFAFSAEELAAAFDSKSISAFRALGGLQGLLQGLRTDRSSGLSLDEVHVDRIGICDEVTILTNPGLQRQGRLSSGSLAPIVPSATSWHSSSERYVDRRRTFGENRLPEKKTKNLFQIMWITFNDTVLIILTIVAAIPLALGLYQDFARPEDGPKVRWVEGVTIMVAVIIVVVVGSLNDYQKERQFIKLNKTKENRVVKAIRSGNPMELSIYDILVGDVLLIEPGDLLPADGVFISGHNVVCDESSATGELDQMRKIPCDEVMAQIEAGSNDRKLDPFIISGSKVLEGVGTYLVTAVGIHSSYGKIMMSFTSESERTPLQTQLNTLAEQISKIGCVVALLLFTVLLIRFLLQLYDNPGTLYEKFQEFLQILIVSITIIVIAVPEGLPLAVVLALAFAVTRMLKDHNLVRVLRACEVMGNVTSVCTDKTGTLTLNKMTVVAGALGTDFKFSNTKEPGYNQALRQGSQGYIGEDAAIIPSSKLGSELSPEAMALLSQSIAINSTAFESREDGHEVFIGSKTETALLSFAKIYLGLRPVSEERANVEVIQMIPFDSRRKCMVSVIKLSQFHYRMLVKGAPEVLLRKCTQFTVDVKQCLKVTALTNSKVDLLTRTFDGYATNSLRTIGLAYRDFDHWPPPQVKTILNEPNEAVFEDVFENMVFLGVFGIRDPVRPGVAEAVAQCQHAGVCVRMITGDSVKTAVAVARECGIYTEGGLVMEGPEFRKLSTSKMDLAVPKLQVLARSSPEDKRIFVKRLKHLGETVAATGDGTNDGPALKTADVGFSMGLTGTEVAKEASSIVLMDDNFASIVKALAWGRTINDAVKKFLQFQITVNITAVVLTFVSAIASNKEEPILTPVQLLWVNLIMDTFAALALATDPPAPSILDRQPDPRSTPLITLTMWKMIIGQSIYQLAVTLALNFRGNEILGYTTKEEQDNLETLIFNVYVWMQFFNQYNNRRLDNKFNIFEGIHRNFFFIAINIIMVSGQLLIVFFGGSALSTQPLNVTQWAISLILGGLSLLVAMLVRLIPDALIHKLLVAPLQRLRTPYTKTANTRRFKWNDTIENVRDQLAFYKTIRGRPFGRFFASEETRPLLGSTDDMDYSSSESLGPTSMHGYSRNGSESQSVLAPATVMAGVIAGSIAGWYPREISNAEEGSDGAD